MEIQEVTYKLPNPVDSSGFVAWTPNYSGNSGSGGRNMVFPYNCLGNSTFITVTNSLKELYRTNVGSVSDIWVWMDEEGLVWFEEK